MAPSIVTWQPAWHLARRHRSWRRARKYPPDTFLSACFLCCSEIAQRKPPPPLGKRRRPAPFSPATPHAQLRRPPRPSLRPPRPPSSGEVRRARPPTSPGPAAAELPGHRAACSPPAGHRARSGPGSSLPGRRAPTACPLPPPVILFF
jgi:hypothetical protein